MEYPMMSVIDAMQQGVQMGQSIRRKRMEQAQLEQMQRQGQMDDLRNQLLLEGVSRPITGGTVEDVGPDGPNVGGFVAPGIRVRRKPDPSRTVKYKTGGGQAIERELMTPEEQAERDLRTRIMVERALGGLGTELKLGETRALEDMRQQVGMELPGMPGMKFFGSELPRVAPSMVAAQGRADDRASREGQADASRKAAEERQRVEHEFRRGEGEKNRANARTVAGIRKADGPTAGQEGVQSRFTERQRENDRKTLRDLQAKEDTMHARRLQIGEILKAGTEDEKGAAELHAELKGLDLRVKSAQGLKRKIIEKWQGKGAGRTEAKPAAPARPRAVNPQTGEAVEFDGAKWVPVQ